MNEGCEEGGKGFVAISGANTKRVAQKSFFQIWGLNLFLTNLVIFCPERQIP